MPLEHNVDDHAGRPTGCDEIVRLRLYVAGSSAKSLEAIANLQAICEEYLPGCYELQIIDVLVESSHTLSEDIVVTPTLVKVAPGPAQMVVGNLSSRATVLYALGLDTDSRDAGPEGED